jgi:hypothetical protein
VAVVEYHKTSCIRNDMEMVLVRCPRCQKLHDIRVGNDGIGEDGHYDVDSQGRLYPQFVCMARDLRKKPICFHEEWLWIVNL